MYREYRPSFAGLKNDGQRDATASTPMELACLVLKRRKSSKIIIRRQPFYNYVYTIFNLIQLTSSCESRILLVPTCRIIFSLQWLHNWWNMVNNYTVFTKIVSPCLFSSVSVSIVSGRILNCANFLI